MKRTISLFLSVAFTLWTLASFSLCTYATDSVPVISLKGGYASESSVTTVTASIDSEVNIAAYSIALYFDPTYVEVTDARCANKYGTFFSGESAEDMITLIWSDSLNRTIKGDLFTVSFKTKSDSAGHTVPIEIGYSVLGDETTGEIPFEARGCEINILNEYMWGDASCDGILSVSDAIIVNRYTSDSKNYKLSETQLINSDTDKNGIVNFKDCENILKRITGI